ncbi:16994_t:CDS:2, partial [Funneliformis geosporum]
NLSEFLEKLFSTSTKSNFTLQNPHNEGMDELGFGKSGMVMNSELISWKRNRMLSVLLLMNASYLKNQVNLTQKLCWLDTKVHLLSQYCENLLIHYNPFTTLCQKVMIQSKRTNIQVYINQVMRFLDKIIHFSKSVFDNEKQDDITQNSSKVNYNDVTDDVIRSNLIEVFISEIDTAESSLSFIMYYLCKYPYVKKRLFDEIDVIFSSNTLRDITFKDIENSNTLKP